MVSCGPKAPETTQSGVAAATAAAPTETKEIKTNMATLTNPAAATEKAPETFKVKFDTTKGDFTIEVTRAWSPLGADRFYNLVKAGFFTDVAFFRVIEGFMVQFGIHGDPAVATAWRGARIQDDPVVESNKPGYVSYAMAGPNTRTSQMFINFGNNARLDGMGFSPFGKVTDGMSVVNSLYSGYGEGAPSGMGPDQGRVQSQGNKYLKAEFPKMDYIKSADLLK
ncbi:MAG: peptidylprolyl isomerase [Elusimicrobiota bacterium]|nr:peptidylprolyl isomerase [Elusimicrobiota bacterium]